MSATHGTIEERQFAEREWKSLLHGLLLEAEERHPQLLWINRPSVSAMASSKYKLLTTADLSGLQTPATYVSTDGTLPNSRSGQYVAKAINEDETIDDQRTFSTTPLPHEVLAAQRYDTLAPSLIQERIKSDYELRIYYLLDRLLALTLAPSSSYDDIRLVPQEAILVRRVDPPPHLATAIRRYCMRYGFSYCVFDFLPTPDGRHLLIDVTPGGTWSYYEPSAEPFIADWYADTVRRSIGTGHETRTGQ